MNLTVNGEEKAVSAATLADLLPELEFEGDWLATAVNSELIAADGREAFQLSEGDKVEILAPMQGG
ncbi:thiamine biosynthesis protein ThiS [Roseibium sp. TrichSKD4]|uniref:sulfur carrier protein ThiS n=1 Tax=Roseibium sp. TrichSKD4 TaxID=744980 RepID=UPI0001E5652C|nr:sulfur carrier protein ThiS [Roseibium sp. TrichSKD4]EFO34042.1 thiamine biosynthesis protein ThiS [Roseibium sp. TrichSKD4]